MTRNYEIDLYDGHLIIEEEGRTLLLDTGSPVSLTDLNEFEFMGRTHRGTPSIGGSGIGDVSCGLGKEIDVLVGMDVLSKFIMTVDYAGGRLEVTDETFAPAGTVVPIRKSMMGALMVTMTVDGANLNFALDTGAKISYINHRVTSADKPVAERKDTNPLIGDFMTPIFPKTVVLGDRSFECMFGNLPQMAEMPLSMVGIDGVIGYDLFSSFQVILDFRNGVLALS